jgi:cytochrome c6
MERGIRWLLGAMVALVLLFALFWPPPAWGAAAVESASSGHEAGARLFTAHCAACHPQGGNIIRRGKTLKRAALQRQGIDSPEAIQRIAAAGIGQMSGYDAVLGEGGAERVAAWIWQQAELGWPRNRPPRESAG